MPLNADAECRHAECIYAECQYAQCNYSERRFVVCRLAECRGTAKCVVALDRESFYMSPISYRSYPKLQNAPY
jgi:hypothetical protein